MNKPLCVPLVLEQGVGFRGGLVKLIGGFFGVSSTENAVGRGPRCPSRDRISLHLKPPRTTLYCSMYLRPGMHRTIEQQSGTGYKTLKIHKRATYRCALRDSTVLRSVLWYCTYIHQTIPDLRAGQLLNPHRLQVTR